MTNTFTQNASAWEVTGTVNGRTQTRRQIGWYIIPEETTVDHYGEYAADWWCVRVPAGKYPVYALRDCGRRWHSLSLAIPGTLCAVSPWRARGGGERLGEPRVAHISPYAHSVALSILQGNKHYELLDDVEARRIEFTHDGKPCATYGLFFADGDQA